MTGRIEVPERGVGPGEYAELLRRQDRTNELLGQVVVLLGGRRVEVDRRVEESGLSAEEQGVVNAALRKFGVG